MTLVELWGAARARARTVLSSVMLMAALVVLGMTMNEFAPLHDWLPFRFAKYWLFTLVFGVASLGAGLLLLRALERFAGRAYLRQGERLVLGFALGVWIFAQLVFLVGLLGALGGVMFVLLPVVLVGISFRELRDALLHTRRLWSEFGRRLLMPRSAVETLAICLGGLGLLCLYVQVCTPMNLGADTHWYHLPIAEHYAASGEISAFREGWYLGAYTHMGSILYTWGFCQPFADLSDRALLCAHLEFFLFVVTLISIAPLVRRVSGSGRYPWSGTVLFLFPGLFVYDSGLIAGADHILAFFMPALAISVLRLARVADSNGATIVALLLAATALTKPQGIYVVPIVVLGCTVLLIRKKAFQAFLVLGGVALVATSSHWLKNWLWYGDPVYPMGYRVFPNIALYDGAPELFKHAFFYSGFRYNGPPSGFWPELLKTSADFAFVPHNWNFHGERPVFGFLYSVLLPVLFFQKRPGRALFVALGVQAGVVVWFASLQLDRYLQALIPWMTTVVVVTLARVWELGRVVKGLTVALVGLQVLWSADIPFYRVHAMQGDSPLKAFIDFAAPSDSKSEGDRRRLWGTLQDVGSQLPPHSKVLLHEVQERLGLQAPSISDRLRWQGRIHYARSKTPRAVAELMRDMEVTHAVWQENLRALSFDGVANEVAFADWVLRSTKGATTIGGYKVAEVDSHSPQDAPDEPLSVALISCNAAIPSGITTPDDLARERPRHAPLPKKNRDVDALVIQATCKGAEGKVLSRKGFQRFSTVEGWEVWMRGMP